MVTRLLHRRGSLAPLALLIACGPTTQPGGGRTPSTQPDTGSVAELAESGPVSCAGDRTAGPFERRVKPVPTNSSIWLWAGGVVVADVTGDGRLDVLSPTEPAMRLYRQTEAGTYAEDNKPFPSVALDYGTGGSVADYDGDGNLDLYLTRFARPNVLLRNLGDGAYEDMTARAGVAAGRARSMSSAWADMDRDGDLDLFVGNYGHFDESGETETEDFSPAEPSFLYINNGDGTFQDRSADLPQEVHDGYTYVAGWHDLNLDGWPDLYVVNDFGVAFHNRLLWNREGTLQMDDGSAGLNLELTGMGLAVGDLSGDGRPDLLIPEWNNNVLLEYNELLDGWVDHTQDLGMVGDPDAGQLVGWGAAFADLDNDADLEALVAYGSVRYDNPVWENPSEQPDALFVADDQGDFTDEATAWGVADSGVGRGFMTADLNGDGFLDLVKRDLAGPDLFYLSRCDDSAWLKVRLADSTSANTAGVGARVTVEVDGVLQHRSVIAGGTNYASAGPPEVHFGLGEADRIDSIEVLWPDGETRSYTDLATRQVVRIRR
jgi:enediyne biosynthesis protein E4